MLKNCSSEMISVYLQISVNSFLKMAAEKGLVWFLLRIHRTIKAVKGPQEISNRISCPKQGQLSGQSRLLLPWTSRSLKLLRYRLSVICHAASLSSSGNSLSFCPLELSSVYSWIPKITLKKKYTRKIMLQHKPVEILWLVPIRTWYFPFVCFH